MMIGSGVRTILMLSSKQFEELQSRTTDGKDV